MPRRARSRDFQAQFGNRFGKLLDHSLQVSHSELARRLGYANATTLGQVRDGRAGMDLEKLAALGAQVAIDGGKPNLDWLLMARGMPTLLDVSYEQGQREACVSIIEHLPNSEITALLALLRAWHRPPTPKE